MPGSKGSTMDIATGLTVLVIRAGKTTAVKLIKTISNVIKNTTKFRAIDLFLAI